MLCPIGQSNEKPPLQALAKWQEYVTCVRNHRRSIYPGYGHRNPGRAGMEDLPEGKVSDSVDEIDGMKCVWRKELAE